MQSRIAATLVKLLLALIVTVALGGCAARAVVGAGAFAAKTTAKAAKTTVKTGAAAAHVTGRAIGGTVRAVTP